MSVLTKIFVVLHVVMSLLLTAGLIVFVNRQEPFKDANDKLTADLHREQSAHRASEAQIVAQRGEMQSAIDGALSHAAALASALDAANQEVLQRSAEVNTSRVDSEKSKADLAITVLALKAAQDASGALEKNVTDIRAQLDDAQKKYGETSLAVSDLTNKLDVMTKRYQNGQEQITAMNDQIDKLRGDIVRSNASSAPGARGMAAPAGVPVATGDAGVASAAGSTPVKGVVRARKNINGVEYATISVGSADNVIKGMKFKVLSKNQFLGYMTVDSVDYNESTGHLEGPSIAAVQPGVEVRTNW